MTTAPDVSVVMAVCNGGETLSLTIDSVLAQTGVSFEFVIVNDGSTDGTAELLGRYAERDNRVRVLHQQNVGLTLSLIRGCSQATGNYIARQDAGDLSVPGRLETQFDELEANPTAVMTSCATQYVGPEGEVLHSVIQPASVLHEGLARLSQRTIRGPSHHGSVLFRKCTYESVGGYRPEFEVAQDLDLWMRLREAGECLSNPALLYIATLSPGSISQRRRNAQVTTTKAIIECAALRRAGSPDRPALERWINSRARKKTAIAPYARRQQAQFYYHLGCLLRIDDPHRARFYFLRALRAWPFNAKAFCRLLQRPAATE